MTTVLHEATLTKKYRDDPSTIPTTESGHLMYKPSLLLCPAAVVGQTYDELARLFGNEIVLHVFYQGSNNCNDAMRRGVTLSNNEELTTTFQALQKNHRNPEVSLASHYVTAGPWGYQASPWLDQT